MPTVTTRVLKAQLSSYLQRAEAGEQIVVLRGGQPVAALVPMSKVRSLDQETLLAELGTRGLVELPKRASRTAFHRPTVPNRGTLASERIIEDRR